MGGDSDMGDRMVVVSDELVDLKGMWSFLTPVWEALDELRDEPRKVMSHALVGVACDVCCYIGQAFP